MEDVVDTLEVGELSEPFRTQTGWHIAEVLDRRETDSAVSTPAARPPTRYATASLIWRCRTAAGNP